MSEKEYKENCFIVNRLPWVCNIKLIELVACNSNCSRNHVSQIIAQEFISSPLDKSEFTVAQPMRRFSSTYRFGEY